MKALPLPPYREVHKIRLGEHPRFDAWLHNMMIDNNCVYHINPDIIASPEQIRFMVALDDTQVYIPCSDTTFFMLTQPEPTAELRKQYNRAWRIIMRLIRSIERRKLARQSILELCRYRFRQLFKGHTIIPSRLVKRMTNIVFAESGQDDPWILRRRENNHHAYALIQSAPIRQALRTVSAAALQGDMYDIQRSLHYLELTRLMYLASISRQWLQTPPTPHEIHTGFTQAENTTEPLQPFFHTFNASPKVILMICDADSGTVFDMTMAERLIRMGHKVIMAFKAGFYFYAPTMTDADNDPTYKLFLQRGTVIHETALNKNELLRSLREYQLVIINDGTRERLNLYRTSVTFARAWKEADLIMAKGWRNAETLLNTSHTFTRDILCYWIDTQGEYRIHLKKHAEGIQKFNETELREKADTIIAHMREAKQHGRSVLFYSCIIGSIPGQTAVAIEIVHAFMQHLRHKMDDTCIINPTEHFTEGMDGDDLMFMWERVQRSGYIDIWRFQTVQDIEESFALLNKKIPTPWIGKDATYSTGCTKEMRIALDMQKRYKEMQIIGPDPERFLRRNEYGIGKYYDARIIP